MDVVLPEPWLAHRAQGTDWTFYYNRVTGESTWKHPQPSQCEDEEVEVEVEPDDVESSYPEEATGNARGHKGYQSTDVDEHGRLRPRPKKRPAVPAGNLVLKSVNAVASAGSPSGGSAPLKSMRRAGPSHPAARSAASPRPERVKKTETTVTSRGSVKRGPQAGPPMRDPRRLPPSIWFMEGDPDDDALLPPPKAVAKAKAKPRTARAQARMMSTLLKISQNDPPWGRDQPARSARSRAKPAKERARRRAKPARRRAKPARRRAKRAKVREGARSPREAREGARSRAKPARSARRCAKAREAARSRAKRAREAARSARTCAKRAHANPS
eukprot:s1930_g2.t1